MHLHLNQVIQVLHKHEFAKTAPIDKIDNSKNRVNGTRGWPNNSDKSHVKTNLAMNWLKSVTLRHILTIKINSPDFWVNTVQ